MSNSNSIVLKHVTKRFGKSVAVEDMSLEIPANGFISLLGPSGCGKTTTLRMIAGLESPTEGEIWIGDRLVFSSKTGVDVPPNERNIGFLFQNYALWPHMTVFKNIAFGLENMKWKKEDIRKKANGICEMLRLTPYMERYPGELSGGQQQRVAIARTLATDPQILLMDEPLSNLDAKLRLDMRAELKRLHRTTSATFVYVTHDQIEAMALSTSICLMNTAVVQQFAPPLELYERPVNHFAADFVGNPSINFMDFSLREENGKSILEREGFRFGTQAEDENALRSCGGSVCVGIRPENILVSDSGNLEAEVVSSFPYGMETTLVLNLLGTNVRAVVFGTISFPEGKKVKVNLTGNELMMFHPENEKLVTVGRLEQV